MTQEQALEQIMSIAQLVVATGLVSMVMPALVAIVNQSSWSHTAKETTVAVVCIVVGFLGVAASGHPLNNLLIVIPLMIGLTRKAYMDYWKPTGLADWIEKLTDVRKEPL